MRKRLYRVSESEHFNLLSMYEHLKVMEIEMLDGEIAWQDDLPDRIAEVEGLMDKATCVGALVDWPTLARIREIKAERQMIRYTCSLAAGSSERDAALAFRFFGIDRFVKVGLGRVKMRHRRVESHGSVTSFRKKA